MKGISGVFRGGALSLLATIAVAASGEAQSYTIKFVGDSADAGTLYVSPVGIRRVSQGASSSSSALDYDVIDRVDRGILLFVDHKTRTYQERSAAEFEAYLDRQSERMEAEIRARKRDPRGREALRGVKAREDSTVEKLGAGGNIAGYPTERYRLEGPMAQAELWITQSLQCPAAYYRDFNLFNGVSTPLGKWDKILGLHGVVLKKVVTMRGGMTLSETAMSVDKSPIPPSILEPPAGYRKVAARALGHN